MKKLLVLISVSLFSFSALSQWVVKKIDNGFDTPYKVAYTEDGQSEFLKLLNYKGVAFYIAGVFICDELPTVDISFLVNGEYKKYNVVGSTSDNHERVYISFDLNSDPNLLADFKAASSVKIRINDTTCDPEIHEFKMTGSAAAFDAINNP